MGSIVIVGVGYDDSEPLSEGTVRRLKDAAHVVVPSAGSRVAAILSEAGIDSVPLSGIGLSLDMPGGRLAEGLVDLAEEGEVAFVSAGYPFLKEGLLRGLLSRVSADLEVCPTLNPLQVILVAFDIDLTADLDIVDIGNLAPTFDQRDSHLVVTGIRNRILARKASERLTAVYPPDHQVVVASSSADGRYMLSLHDASRLDEADPGDDAVLYVAPYHMAPPAGFDELVRLIALLRAPEGCPWDRAQTHLSLRRHMLEEAYEAVAAIEAEDSDALAGELGDVLLQILLHSQIAAEHGDFTIDDVVAGIAAKIRRRHPHVFADVSAETPEQVGERWDAIKREEKGGGGLLDDVPASLPALMRAQKISRRVVGVGFEWETLDDVWEKFAEEVEELKETEPGSPEAAEEIGDLLFTLVNVARKQGIDAEEALRGSCGKFIARWRMMEREASRQGLDIGDLGMDEMERMWQEAKKHEGEEEEPESGDSASSDLSREER